MKRLGIVGGGIYFVIVSITQPFFSLYASELGASTALIGILITLRSFLPLFIAMPSGQLIDRYGAPYMLRIGSAITVVSLVMMVGSANLWVLGFSQVIIGVGTLIMASSLQVIVSEGEKKERDLNITRYSAWSSAGTMAGPLVGGAIVSITTSLSLFGMTGSASEIIGYRMTFVFSLVLAIVFWLFVIWFSRDKVSKSLNRKALKEVLAPKEIADSYLKGAGLMRHPGVQFGLVGTFLIHFLQAIWGGFFPLYLDSLGYGAMAISILVSLRGAASLISRTFLGFIMKILTQERILLMAGCIAALCLGGLPLVDWNLVLIGIITFVLGSATGINMPVSTMIMVNDTLPDERGKLMGLRLLANRLSQIVGPLLFGVVGQGIGLAAAFYAGGGVLLATIVGFGAYNRSRMRSGIQPSLTKSLTKDSAN